MKIRIARSLAVVLLSVAWLCTATAAHATWPRWGVRVAGNAQLLSVLPDSAGGGYVVWTGRFAGDSIRVVRLDATGEVASGWPAGGLAFASPGFSTDPNALNLPRCAATDGLGGVYLFCEGRSTDPFWIPGNNNVVRYVWHLAGGGDVQPGWPKGAGSYYTPGGGPGLVYENNFHGGGMANAAGRAYFAWDSDYFNDIENVTGTWAALVDPDTDPVLGTLNTVYAYYVAPRSDFVSAGRAVAQAYRTSSGGSWFDSWDGDSLPKTRTLSGVLDLGIVPLLPGDDVIGWWQTGSSSFQVLRMQVPSLAEAPGWPAGGITSPTAPVLEDGQGGAFMRVPDAGGDQLQRVSFATVPPTVLWPGPTLPALRSGWRVRDDGGGLYQVWNPGGAVGELRAEHILADGGSAWDQSPDGILLSPLAMGPVQVAGIGGGRALVAWTDAGADSNAIYVQLLTDPEPVLAVASPVSTAKAIELRGFLSNPIGNRAAIELRLPDSAPATLDVFDVSGRRLVHRDVGALGAGLHRVALPELTAARAGLLFARLARGSEVCTARATKIQ